jgi:ATP phosphoribosyltransferase regulatory subunit
MTPQIARLVAARLSDAPSPARLCYEGAVVRRRAERARRDRQIHQAGFELVGQAGPEGDLEVLTVAASAVRAAGLVDYTLDLGHAGVAAALLSGVGPEQQASVVHALAAKDSAETRRRAERAGLKGKELAALAELPNLCGGAEVWARAERVLQGTAAVGPARELRSLFEKGSDLGLSARLVADLGETWSFAYYSGMLFHVLADGPGEPVGAGGRYDSLFDRFRCPRPAAGFAVDLGNLSWALQKSGHEPMPLTRILVVSDGGPLAAEVLGELRRAGIACAPAPETDARAYAVAWRYTHLLTLRASGATLASVGSNEESPFPAGDAKSIAREAAKSLKPSRSKEEAT